MKHPVWKAYRNIIQIDENVPKEALPEIEKYRLILCDVWLERVANKLIGNCNGKLYKVADVYKRLRAKKRYDLADKFREILTDVGFTVKVMRFKDREDFVVIHPQII